jgi:uncharacterized protein YqeY
MNDQTLKARLQTAMKVAMKAKEREKLQTIRSVLSAIQYVEMEKGDVNDQEIIAVLKTELKKRHEEIEFAEKAGRKEQIVPLNLEIAVIEEFLPSQLSASDVKKFLVEQYSDKSGLTIGGVMKVLNESFPGQVDGKIASTTIREFLVA